MRRVISTTGAGRTLAISSFSLAAALLAQSASAALVMHYNFDEASGNAINVANPGTYDGALNAGGNIARSSDTPGGLPISSVLSTGVDGHAAGGYITVQGNSSQDPIDLIDPVNSGTNKFTLVTWYKTGTTILASDALISNQASTGGLNWQIQNVNSTLGTNRNAFTMQLVRGNSFRFTNRSAVIDGTTDNTPSGPAKWLFLAATFDGTALGTAANQNIHFYLGSETGAVLEMNDATGTPGTYLGETSGVNDDTSIPFSNATALRVNQNPRTGNNVSNAAYDDVRIYNEVLDLAGLEAVRSQGVPEPTALTGLLIAGAALVRRRRQH